eukprot:Selendium_serpulae@DN6495_c1_g1_i11.p1
MKPLPERMMVPEPPPHVTLPFEGTTESRAAFKPAPDHCYKRDMTPLSVPMVQAPEDRDFGTAYRVNFKGHVPDVCQISKLPAYPGTQHNPEREQMFWNREEKTWY